MSDLRLVYPVWQGATGANTANLLPEFPPEQARGGYPAGTELLAALIRPDAPTRRVAVPETESPATGGVESRTELAHGLQSARGILDQEQPERVLTLGGDCSASVAPFSYLASRYAGDLAVVWIDAHPDSDTLETAYEGFHAMAVSALLGEVEVPDLPATLPREKLALAGLHNWEEDAYANVLDWQLTTFAPEQLRANSDELLDWLRATGASKVAVHLDVDVVDADEVVLGLGAVPGGLSITQVRRLLADVRATTDLVGLTIAEYIPRQVMQLTQLLDGAWPAE